jgi:hypothetical protein
MSEDYGLIIISAYGKKIQSQSVKFADHSSEKTL